MGALIGLIMNSKAGRWAIAGGAALIGLLALLLKTFHSGAKAEQSKAMNQKLDEVDSAKQVDDAVAGRTVAANRKRLQQWSRD